MSADKSRLRRLQRILTVQGQKRLLEEWRLSQLKQAEAEIDRDDAALLASLDAGSQLHGMFIEAKVKTLRRNDTERRGNRQRQSVTETRIVNARRAEKGVERLRDEARSVDAAGEEAKTLEGTLDVFLARRSASLE